MAPCAAKALGSGSANSKFHDHSEFAIELIPFSFRYIFTDEDGKEHKLKIVDWEIYQLYRNVQHREDWRDAIKQKYLTELGRRELHLFLGTIHVHPRSWIIIGVYYPTSTVSQFNMFNS